MLALRAFYEIPKQTQRERLEEQFGMKIIPVGAEQAAFREQAEFGREQTTGHQVHDLTRPWLHDPEMEEA